MSDIQPEDSVTVLRETAQLFAWRRRDQLLAAAIELEFLRLHVKTLEAQRDEARALRDALYRGQG